MLQALLRLPMWERLARNVRAEWTRARLRVRKRAVIRDYLASHEPRKLHIGCGPNLLDGWLNTDIGGRRSIRLDATRRFPFPDASFDYIFSEHMIEHVSYPDARAMLVECHRVLKRGGKIRIATPDLTTLVGLHADTCDNDQRRYIDEYSGIYRDYMDGSGATFVINAVMRNFGHLFIYDRAALGQLIEKAGFGDVEVRATGESEDEHLRGLEAHGRLAGNEWVNHFETLVLEGTKESSTSS
jgi:predicted SAM-dependent methyltransferase